MRPAFVLVTFGTFNLLQTTLAGNMHFILFVIQSLSQPTAILEANIVLYNHSKWTTRRAEKGINR